MHVGSYESKERDYSSGEVSIRSSTQVSINISCSPSILRTNEHIPKAQSGAHLTSEIYNDVDSIHRLTVQGYIMCL